MTIRAWAVKSGFLVAAAIAVTAGCSSTDEGELFEKPAVRCGPGTEYRNEECVVTGDAASPRPDSDGVADTGLPPPDAGLDATGDAASDADGAAAVSDPCPSGPIALNCSETCGAKYASCSLVSCANPNNSYFPIYETKDLPFLMRTPDRPGFDPACARRCGTNAPAYAMAAQLLLPWGTKVRVRVSAPWRIVDPDSNRQFCSSPREWTQCRHITVSGGNIVLVVTDDPSSPSRNVVIEEADQCP
jgi:hypothetical protein